MTLSPDEAAHTLRAITAVEMHSRHLYGYRQGSPHLILWGILWAIGYGLTALWPTQGHAIWASIVAIGLIAGYAISLRCARRIADATWKRPRVYWRFPAITLTTFAFICASFAVMAPVNGRQVGAFIPLVLAAAYVVMGLWLGLRFIAVGTALAALTLAGFFLLPAYFGWWMAAVGGGALLLGGLWLRRA